MRRYIPTYGLVLWAFVAVLACWRLDPAERPITGDNQLYFYLAERAASGVAPHVSLVDTKSQLGVLATAAAISAGRAVGIDDVASSRGLSIAAAAAAVALAGATAALLAGSAAAGHVAALAMLASRGFTDHAATGSNPKVFLAAFLLLAHAALARASLARGRRPALDLTAGAAAAAAFLCWQPALLVVAAVALEALAARTGSARRFGLVLAGALVPLAAYGLYFALHGALGEQLYQEYAMPLGSVHTPRRFLQSVAFVMTEARGAASLLRVGPLSFAVVAIFVAAGMLRDASLLSTRPGALAFACGAAAATAFTLYDHQGVPDLFLVAPYFAVSAGVLAAMASAVLARAVAGALEKSGASSERRPVWAAAAPVALAVLLVLQMARDDSLRPRRGYSLADQRRVAGQVGEIAGTADVWVYEAVHLLGLAHLDNHVPLALFYDDVRSSVDVDAWRPLRDGRLPDVVVHGRSGIPGAKAWLEDAYDDATPPGLASQGLRLWRARSQVRAGPSRSS
jgi:hypothetical protein